MGLWTLRIFILISTSIIHCNSDQFLCSNNAPLVSYTYPFLSHPKLATKRATYIYIYRRGTDTHQPSQVLSPYNHYVLPQVLLSHLLVTVETEDNNYLQLWSNNTITRSFSGHFSSSIAMECMNRDILDFTSRSE